MRKDRNAQTRGVSRGSLIFGAGLVGDRPPPPPTAPKGNVKLIRVGDQDIALTRGERKQVMRKLVAIGIERGDTLTKTPSIHANRRSQRASS
jgi:hypothetical protein